MKMKQLGNSNLQVSAIGLGCMGMSEFYGRSDELESITTLNYAIKSGVNFFDTADVYGLGANEELVGRVLKPYRQNIVLATKFGIVRDSGDVAVRNINGKPDYVKAACDASLKRLGMDVIDLYYLHRVDTTVPIEETVGAMADLVKAGKVRYLGLSEASVKTIRKAHAVHPITALQTEYSLWSRGPERDVIPLCKELNITFIPYSPLGRGFLTNKITSLDNLEQNDFRRVVPRFSGENLEKNRQLVAELAKLAEIKLCTPAQLALAWVMAKSPNIVPIPGTRRQKYLAENIAAADIHLSQAEIQALDTLFKPEAIAGERFPEIFMSLVDL